MFVISIPSTFVNDVVLKCVPTTEAPRAKHRNVTNHFGMETFVNVIRNHCESTFRVLLLRYSTQLNKSSNTREIK